MAVKLTTFTVHTALSLDAHTHSHTHTRTHAHGPFVRCLMRCQRLWQSSFKNRFRSASAYSRQKSRFCLFVQRLVRVPRGGLKPGRLLDGWRLLDRRTKQFACVWWVLGWRRWGHQHGTMGRCCHCLRHTWKSLQLSLRIESKYAAQ